MNATEAIALSLPLVTLLGIFVSLGISNRTLNEIKEDRILSQKPQLIFEQGGYSIPVEFVKGGPFSPGINPHYIKSLLVDFPEDATSIRIHETLFGTDIGVFQNFGRGPAFNIWIIWKPEKIKYRNMAERPISTEDLKKPIFSEDLNTRCLSKRNLFPGGKTGLIHTPMFIEKDYEKSIEHVQGLIRIECQDSIGNVQKTHQEFNLFTEYDKIRPHIVIAFGDIVSPESKKNKTIGTTSNEQR